VHLQIYADNDYYSELVKKKILVKNSVGIQCYTSTSRPDVGKGHSDPQLVARTQRTLTDNLVGTGLLSSFHQFSVNHSRCPERMADLMVVGCWLLLWKRLCCRCLCFKGNWGGRLDVFPDLADTCTSQVRLIGAVRSAAELYSSRLNLKYVHTGREAFFFPTSYISHQEKISNSMRNIECAVY